MTLREAFASALQFLRARRGLSQYDIAPSVAQSYVSRLEAGKRSVSLEMSAELADAIGLHPLSFLALVYAAKDGRPAHEIIRLAEQQLSEALLLQVMIAPDRERLPQRRKVGAALTARAVLEQKNHGKTQAEAARSLQISTSTVGRYWHTDS